jgi:hypothetical protein
MARTKEQQRGFDFEHRVANLLGGKVQPGSGNQFYAKGDCIANGLLISCKSNRCYTWPEILRRLFEAIDDAHGTGNIPALAIEDNSEDREAYIVIRLSDFAKAFSDDIKIENSKESKGVQKRKEIDIPLMLR